MSQLGVYGKMCATDIWVEARDAKILPQQNNYMAQNVNCAEAEESYLGGKVLLLLSAKRTKTKSMGRLEKGRLTIHQHTLLILP